MSIVDDNLIQLRQSLDAPIIPDVCLKLVMPIIHQIVSHTENLNPVRIRDNDAQIILTFCTRAIHEAQNIDSIFTQLPNLSSLCRPGSDVLLLCRFLCRVDPQAATIIMHGLLLLSPKHFSGLREAGEHWLQEARLLIKDTEKAARLGRVARLPQDIIHLAARVHACSMLLSSLAHTIPFVLSLFLPLLELISTLSALHDLVVAQIRYFVMNCPELQDKRRSTLIRALGFSSHTHVEVATLALLLGKHDGSERLDVGRIRDLFDRSFIDLLTLHGGPLLYSLVVDENDDNCPSLFRLINGMLSCSSIHQPVRDVSFPKGLDALNSSAEKSGSVSFARNVLTMLNTQGIRLDSDRIHASLKVERVLEVMPHYNPSAIPNALARYDDSVEALLNAALNDSLPADLIAELTKEEDVEDLSSIHVGRLFGFTVEAIEEEEELRVDSFSQLRVPSRMSNKRSPNDDDTRYITLRLVSEMMAAIDNNDDDDDEPDADTLQIFKQPIIERKQVPHSQETTANKHKKPWDDRFTRKAYAARQGTKQRAKEKSKRGQMANQKSKKS